MEIGFISTTSVKQKIVLRLKAAEDDRDDGCIDGRELTESDIKAAYRILSSVHGKGGKLH